MFLVNTSWLSFPEFGSMFEPHRVEGMKRFVWANAMHPFCSSTLLRYSFYAKCTFMCTRTYVSVRKVQENMHPVTLTYYSNVPSERPPLFGPIRKVGASPVNTWLLVIHKHSNHKAPQPEVYRSVLDCARWLPIRDKLVKPPVREEVTGTSLSLGL